MLLEFESGEEITEPSFSQISSALEALDEKDNSAIKLQSENGEYLQAAINQEGNLHLVHYESSKDKYYLSEDNQSLPAIKKALIDFVENNSRWHSSRSWEELYSVELPSTMITPFSSILFLLGVIVFVLPFIVSEELEMLLGFALEGKEYYVIAIALGLMYPAISDISKWRILRNDITPQVLLALFFFVLMLLLILFI